jgi:hypothetical protein
MGFALPLVRGTLCLEPLLRVLVQGVSLGFFRQRQALVLFTLSQYFWSEALVKIMDNGVDADDGSVEPRHMYALNGARP